MKVTMISSGTWNEPEKIVNGPRRLRNQTTRTEYPDYSIIKIGQNTVKSPGDLRKLAIT